MTDDQVGSAVDRALDQERDLVPESRPESGSGAGDSDGGLFPSLGRVVH